MKNDILMKHVNLPHELGKNRANSVLVKLKEKEKLGVELGSPL